jgi:glycosyltransferase involved in cell wall biosynthesis
MSVLHQESPFDVEVIVVNDSGSALSPNRWQTLDCVRVVGTGRGWTGLPNARNTGAAAACGDFLYFLDDDDELMDGGFAAFASALQEHPRAEWMYGRTERWTRSGEYIDTLPGGTQENVLAALFSGEWMPVQASLIHVDLFRRVGGFDGAFRASEDMDFIMRLSCSTDRILVDHPVCRYHFGLDDSMARRDLDSCYLFDAYEKIMDRPDGLYRLRGSATTPHLYGKVARVYLISLKRHARHACYTKLLSRLTEVLVLMAGAGRFLFHKSFWQALRSPEPGMIPAHSA